MLLKKVVVVSQTAGVAGQTTEYIGKYLRVSENVDGRLVICELDNNEETIAVYNKDCWSNWRKME